MKTLRFAPIFLILCACHRGSKIDTDQIYSRHLQHNVKLSILHTKAPNDRADLNLLIINDASYVDKLQMKKIFDSLNKIKKLKPLVIIGVESVDKKAEYGVSDKPDYQGQGSRAGFYDDFINSELYPYAKKQSGVRKFASVAVAGFGPGGLSAFDMAWNHPDKISEVGVFSGSFGLTDQAPADSALATHGVMQAKLRASRKKPALAYWFYAGRNGDSLVAKATGNLIATMMDKKVVGESGTTFFEIPGGENNESSWAQAFPDFLVWAFPAQ